MKIRDLLLGRREELRDLGLNIHVAYSIVAVFLFLAFHALSLSVLEIRLACSSTIISERVLLFIKAKQLLLLYMWLITAFSWLISSTIIGIKVSRKSNMKLRKHGYLAGICSIPFAIAGIVNTFILMISPGRILNCEGESWKSLLIRAFSEIISYLFSFPPIISTFVTIFSLFWFTYLIYRVYRITLGLSREDSLNYSISFTSLFVGLTLVASLILALIIVLLPWI